MIAIRPKPNHLRIRKERSHLATSLNFILGYLALFIAALLAHAIPIYLFLSIVGIILAVGMVRDYQQTRPYYLDGDLRQLRSRKQVIPFDTIIQIRILATVPKNVRRKQLRYNLRIYWGKGKISELCHDTNLDKLLLVADNMADLLNVPIVIV